MALMTHHKAAALTTFLTFLFIACLGAVKPHSAAAQEPSEKTADPVVEVRSTITVGKGKTFDGHGALYDWTGAGDCSQTEGMPPMFKLSKGATLTNLRMRGAPDGIHVKGSNVVIDNITNLDVCEDAISIKLDKNKNIPRDIVISNSKFSHCSDKAIQITRGDNILIENNDFHDCARPVRLKELATNIRVENNRFYKVKSAVKITGGQGSASGNLIDGAKIGFWVEENGTFTDAGGNRVNNVREAIRETDGGRFIKK